MPTDPLATATAQIRLLVDKHKKSWLEATYFVSESLSEEDAKQVLIALIHRQFLSIGDADLAQMIAARLNVPLQWSHARLNGDGEWVEGRGS